VALYRMPVTVTAPSEETEDQYLAEVPALPGCRAWGPTMGEALAYVQSVAAAFIDSYRERGDPLPAALTVLAPAGDTVIIESELLVSA